MPHQDQIEQKIFDFFQIAQKVKSWQQKGEKVVFTNGCFDLLHKGHIQYMAQAADLGDRLVVGVNSDRSVQQLGKGDLRPIKDEQTRAIILSSFTFVSGVVIFNEETPYELIQQIKPNILVKGGDWKINEIVGGDVVMANGGEVQTIEFVEGYSTTNYVEKILNAKS